ncbi:MAG: hypothetical protein AAF297_11115 [Planctomycetota bacterium]
MKRSGLVTAAAAMVFGLVGCESAERSEVSILNESRTAIVFAAWVDGSPIPGVEAGRELAANASTGVVLDHPGQTGPAVAIRVSPAVATGEAGRPYTARMSPPGPYTIAVRGDEGGLTLVRYEGPERTNAIVPPDPHQRGLTDDIPRSNTNFGRP